MELVAINPVDFRKHSNNADGLYISLNVKGPILLSRRLAQLFVPVEGKVFFKILINPTTKGLYIASATDKDPEAFKGRINSDGYAQVSCKSLVEHLAKEYQLAIGKGRKNFVRLEIEETPIEIEGKPYYYVATK